MLETGKHDMHVHKNLILAENHIYFPILETGKRHMHVHKKLILAENHI